MTRDEQLQLIRAKCVEANPEIRQDARYGCSYKGSDDHGHTDKCRVLIGSRPIRLADVLLAIKETEQWGKVLPHPQQSQHQLDIVLHRRSNTLGKLVQIYWNLRKDDLTEQSDETINFLAELLK